MSLFRSVMYSTAPVLKMHEDFFEDYENLKFIEPPTDKEIRDFQFQKLIEFQRQSFKRNKKILSINNFFNYNGYFSDNLYLEDQEIDEALTNINNNVMDILKKGQMSKKYRADIQENQQKQEILINQLRKIWNELQKIRNNFDGTISSSSIIKLDTLINNVIESNNIKGNTIDEVLKVLFKIKGDILEVTGTEWFNKRIPEDLKVKAYNTGAINVGGNTQLIQDILIMDMENMALDNLIIEYKIGENSFSKTLREFLETVEEYSGSQQIIITYDSYKEMIATSLMGIQAKSGENQLPWNVTSKNTWIMLKDGQNIDSRADEYINFLDQMQDLYLTWDIKHQNIKKQTPEYKAMANYILGTQLNKVLHLSQLDNQYVLTPHGFMPYLNRIIELYEKKGNGKYFFSFGGAITLEKTSHILVKARPVIFYK